MASITPGVQPPRPRIQGKDISNLFQEVKKIRLNTNSIDTYEINGSNYSQLMNSIITAIRQATTYQKNNQTADLQTALTNITTIIPSLTIDYTNIQNWNASVHYTRLSILNHFIPNFYAFLILFIQTYLINHSNELISQKYKYRPNQKNPVPDDNLRDYYDTAKNILRSINTNDDVTIFTKRFIQNMVDQDQRDQRATELELQTRKERDDALQANSNYQQLVNQTSNLSAYKHYPKYFFVTPLRTTLENVDGSKSKPMYFDIQNFGGIGDCLFLTLLAIFKVHRPKILVDILTTYQKKHHESQPYSGDVEDKDTDAYILRHVIVDCILSNPKLDIYPNIIEGLTESTKSNSDDTYGARLTLDPNTKIGDRAPAGGVTPSSTTYLFRDCVVTVDQKTRIITSIDKGHTYETEMKKAGTFGTELELSAAVRLFNINIIDVNTNGSEQRFILTDASEDDIAYIFHQGTVHYMNIWPSDVQYNNVNTIKLATTSKSATTALATNKQNKAPHHSGLSGSSTKSKPQLSTPGGVVQVHEGRGDWKNLKSSYKDIFAPIKATIDYLISAGYQHIGFTYSANQAQTQEMFKAYEFNHDEQTKLSQKLQNDAIKTSKFKLLGGTGQGYIMGQIKNELSLDPKYDKVFRIIPFSTMRYITHSDGTQQSYVPDRKSLGSVEDCINFATLFLQLPKSIIIGWAAFKKPKLTNNTVFKDNYFAIGGPIAAKATPTSEYNLKDVVPVFRNWALTNWNPDAQNLVDSFSSKTPPPPKAHPVKTPGKGPSLPSPPPPTPTKGLNSRPGFLKEIKKRITEIAAAAKASGVVNPNIANVVNGGSFNQIHNGHL